MSGYGSGLYGEGLYGSGTRRIHWNLPGDRVYETGVDRGVLYPKTGPGVPWNGLVSINEASSGGDVESLYFDGVKYLDVIAAEDFQATIEAFSTPPEFAACDGTKQLVPGLFATQQPRQSFGLSYRTLIGNDLENTDYGYKLHLVYGCMASPTSTTNQTLSSDQTAPTKQWTINSVPPPASTFKPTAHFVLDSTKIDPYVLANLESHLYGHYDRDPELPSQIDVVNILSNPITEPLSEPI